MKNNKIYFSLRFSILFIFISLFSVGMLTLIGIIYYRLSDNLTYFSLKLMNQITTSVYHEIVDIEMQSAEIISRSITHLIKNDVIDLKNSSDFIKYSSTILQSESEPLIQLVSWGDENGNVYEAEKQANGNVLTQILINNDHHPVLTTTFYDKKGNITHSNIISTNYDPRKRPWYLNAKQTQKTIWSDIFVYQHASNGLLGTGVSTPIYYSNGQLRGVLFIGIRLDSFERAVNNINISQNSRLFIVTQSGKLIALSKAPQELDLSHHLIDMKQVTIPGLAISFNEYFIKKKNSFVFRDVGQDYVATYIPLPDKLPGHWLIGIVTLQDDFINVLKKANILTLSIGIIILLLGIAIVSKLINWIVNPLNEIALETEKIKHFDLDGDTIIQSRIKEINEIAHDIYSMKSGLRSFGKYVPADLVRQLIERGEDAKIGGSRKQLAIFFSDIRDFTNIAENMDPNQLMSHICEYLDELSAIIDRHGGTIDKYIGDSIMAFWGAPLSEHLSPHQAARAALACIKRSNELNEKWKKDRKPVLFTRIGLHLGDAIVGNLGSSHHLNYTAISDAINIANRLEGVNKLYGTQIIVSEPIYHVIKNDFMLRLLDCVIPKGKAQPILIYELLGENHNPTAINFSKYNDIFKKAFTAYQQKDWNSAIDLFKQCIMLYPSDTVAVLFIKRCELYKVSPPPADWVGVWLMEGK